MIVTYWMWMSQGIIDRCVINWNWYVSFPFVSCSMITFYHTLFVMFQLYDVTSPTDVSWCADDVINMSYWNNNTHVINTNDVTDKQRMSQPSAGYHVIPMMRDELYWERECDEALSLRSEGSLSHCDDFDDVIVNANHNKVTPHNVTRTHTNCANTIDESCPRVGVYMIPNDVTIPDDRNQLKVDHLVTETTSQNTSCQDIGDQCNIISHASVHQNRIAQQKAKIAFMTKEVGLHNISKQYFNRLNVVLSVTLVVCCVVGMGLFLLYMLSCDG